jgi:hypothetical protein
MQATSVFKLFETKKENPQGNDVERLVKYLAAMLEYDEHYFSSLVS